MKQPAATAWFEPTPQAIKEDAWYIVQTNGMEWRDHDLFIWKGIHLAMKLDPRFIRGRPILVAEIVKPPMDHGQRSRLSFDRS